MLSVISPAGLLATVRGLWWCDQTAGVVVVAFDFVDFVFGFDVAVLGDADVDADAFAVDVGPIEAGIGDGFLSAIDADAAGAGAAADFFSLLVLQLVEVADAGERFADVADVVLLHAAAAVEEGVAIFGQRVAVRRGEADAGDDNPLMVVERAGHASWHEVGRF